jgi:hypothetical protein
MDPKSFDELEHTLAAEGPAAAIERLCARLREQKDYNSLFYALLMKKRHELGASPIPTGPSHELPESGQVAYEEAIRQAARVVGRLYLDEGNIPQAWAYFRMINEPEVISAALERFQPREDDDLQQLVHIAFYEGAHPRKGFDWILERSGICSAITTLGSVELPHPAEVRRYCIQRLVQALYQELLERLRADIEARTGAKASGRTLRELLAGHDDLFEEDYAHVDVSHLSSVVQMSLFLEPGPELELARELCEYGQRIQSRLQYPGDPPFEDQYRAHGLYLAILAGDNVEEGLDYFRAQAESADPHTVGTYPAEVLVNLLLKLNRPVEALAVARHHLAAVDNRRLSCPSIVELCQKASDYRTLASVAREQSDAVHFLAGLLAANPAGPPA